MARERMQQEAVLVVGSFVALSIVATWPLVRHLTSALPGDLGDPLLNAWTLGWAADRLRHGLIGLWDAPILFPARYTFGFSENLLGIAIFVAPIVWVTGNPILAHNVAFVLSYALAGVGMYLLARELTHRRDAAMIAGAIYAFAPMRASYVSHIQVLASGWMPLALWGLHRYFATRSVRPLAVFVAAFTVEAWSNAYFLYFLAIPAIAVALNELVPALSTRSIDRRALRQLAGGAAAILLLIAWMLFTYATIRRLYGLHRGLGDWQMFSADLRSYFSVPDLVPLWRDWLSGDRAPERQLFPGLIAVLLAALAVSFRSEATRVTRLYATIGAVALILSLGPEPQAWTHRLPLPGPFLWLARIVPGLDGIRAPARLGVVVLLSIAVLAAIGFARLQMRWPQRPWIAAVVLVVVFVEGWALPMRVVAFDAKGRSEDRRLYRWLADEPPGAVLELPIHDWSIAPTLTYQYATLVHHHPIVNGYSGYGTALQGFLGGPASPIRELDRMSDALGLLRTLGIRYVIVHPHDYEDPELGKATAAAIRASSGEVAFEQRFEQASAFRLHDAGAVPAPARDVGIQVAARDLHVTASDNQDRVALAFDAVPATRWMTGHSQNGAEWLRIELDRPHDVSRVTFLLDERTLGDYPRDLMIESSNGGATSLLYQGHTLITYGQSIARNIVPPEIAIDLPANLTRTLTIRQTGSSRRWWSIHELKIWTR